MSASPWWVKSLFISLVEEVFLAEVHEFVVQPVEEGGVAFLDGGRDVAGVAQALDADAEAGGAGIAQAMTSVLSVEKASPRPSSRAGRRQSTGRT